MTNDYQPLWLAATNATDKAQAAQILAKILADKDGEAFVLGLDSENVESCIEMLDHVSFDVQLPRSQPHVVRQGIIEHNLKPTEKQTFFITLRNLVECHGKLPSRTRIAGKIEVAEMPLTTGGLADVWSGTYRGHPVMIKVLKMIPQNDYVKTRKVGVNAGHPGHTISIISFPAILQGSHPLEQPIPSEHLEICGSSGGHKQSAVFHRVGVDAKQEYHGVHRKPSR